MATNEIILKISIDGKEANATLNLTDTNIKELYKSFKYGKQEVNGLTTAISQGFNNAREIIQGFKEAYNVIASAFNTHLTAYQEQEAALVKLNTALQQTNQLTDDNVKSLTDYAAQLQQTTIYGDEVTETVMAQLLAMGLSVEQTKQATLQAANLATVMGTDLNSAARAMADLFNGNAGMIGRYVKGLDETIIKSGDLDKIMAMLNERIGGQAEAMGKTSAGAIAKMNNAIGDMKENAGELLSKALQPFITILSDIFKHINNLSPGLSGLIGIIGSMTTAFITLRVTGILPAISSIELFGVALTGLKAVMIKTGIGALIVGLGYGLSELAKAYEHWKDVTSHADASFENTINKLKSETFSKSKKDIEHNAKDAKEQIEKLKGEIKLLEKKTNAFGYATQQDFNDLGTKKQQLKLYEELLKVYNNALTTKGNLQTGSQIDNGIFEKQKATLLEAQRHETELLNIQDAGEIEQIKLKKKHLEEQLMLYKKYGKDVTEIQNRIIEENLRLEKLAPKQYTDLNIAAKGIESGKQIKPLGEVGQYQKNELLEIDRWAEKEKQKVAIYANADMLRAEIDAEALRRKQDLAEREKQIEEEKEKSKINAQLSTLNFIAQAGNQYTVMSKAVAVFEAYIKGKEAVLTALAAFPPPFNTIAAVAVAAVTAKHIADIVAMQPPKMKGFASGGRLPKGETGFVEGYHNEIIAPEKTFVDVFRDELKPKIYNNLNTDNGQLINEIKALKEALINRPVRAYLDDNEAKKIAIRGNSITNKLRLA